VFVTDARELRSDCDRCVRSGIALLHAHSWAFKLVVFVQLVSKVDLTVSHVKSYQNMVTSLLVRWDELRSTTTCASQV
jgi:hypothetical protein